VVSLPQIVEIKTWKQFKQTQLKNIKRSSVTGTVSFEQRPNPARIIHSVALLLEPNLRQLFFLPCMIVPCVHYGQALARLCSKTQKTDLCTKHLLGRRKRKRSYLILFTEEHHIPLCYYS